MPCILNNPGGCHRHRAGNCLGGNGCCRSELDTPDEIDTTDVGAANLVDGHVVDFDASAKPSRTNMMPGGELHHSSN